MKQIIILFQLTREEKETLEYVYYLEPWLQDAVDYHRKKGNKFQVKLVDDDARDCINALLFHAEQESGNRTEATSLAQKIYRIYQLKNAMNFNDRLKSI